MNQILKGFLLSIILVSFACNDEIDERVEVKTYTNKLLSSEDSIRLKVGLMLIDSTWALDTIKYGIRNKAGILSDISDTASIKNLITRFFYLQKKKSVLKRMEYLDDSLIEEQDSYQSFNADSSIRTTLVINYNYKKKRNYYGSETFDFELQKKNKIEIEKLKKERKENINRAKKDSIQLYECGESYHTPIIELSIAHMKYKKLTKKEFDSILNSF